MHHRTSTSIVRQSTNFWIQAPPKIRRNDMFKSMLSQHLTLSNRFSLFPLFSISKKSFKITRTFEFYGIKVFMKFLKFWTAMLFLYRHIRFLFTISIHQNWMIYRTFYRKLCWFEPLLILTTVNHDSSGSLRGQV